MHKGIVALNRHNPFMHFNYMQLYCNFLLIRFLYG